MTCLCLIWSFRFRTLCTSLHSPHRSAARPLVKAHVESASSIHPQLRNHERQGGDRVRTTHLRPITALRNSLMWMVLITVTPAGALIFDAAPIAAIRPSETTNDISRTGARPVPSMIVTLRIIRDVVAELCDAPIHNGKIVRENQ